MLAAVAPAGLVAVSTLELTLRMVVALAVVGALLWLSTRTAQRWARGRSQRAPIQVLHQQRLDKQAAVTLLAAGDRHFLIGTSGQAMVLLAEGDDLARTGGESRPGGRRPLARSNGGDPSAAGDRAADTASVTDGNGTVDVREPDSKGSPVTVETRRIGPIRALQDRTVRRG